MRECGPGKRTSRKTGTAPRADFHHRLFSHITHNWRARPLTSHEVVVNTIAATTTRAGLRVHAELDHGSYPLKVKISDERMAALPPRRHDWHGDWNYTLDPHPPAPATTTDTPARPTRRDSSGWTHPALTGMTQPEWDHLVTDLTLPHTAYREAELHIRPGGPSWRKPAGGHPPALTLEEKILATALPARFGTPQRELAELFGVLTNTIAKAQRDIRPLLQQRKHTITPARTPIKSLAELTSYAAAHGITLTPGTRSAC